MEFHRRNSAVCPQPADRVAGALRLIDSEIKSGNLSFHRGLRDTVYVHVATFDQSLRIPLAGDQAKDIVHSVLWQRGFGVPSAGEYRQIVRVLNGNALQLRRGNIENPDILEIVREDPTLATLVEWQACTNACDWFGSMSTFWKELHTFSVKHGLYRIGEKKFPDIPNALSRQLRERMRILKQIGFDVEIRRSNGSKITIKTFGPVGPHRPHSSSNSPRPTAKEK